MKLFYLSVSYKSLILISFFVISDNYLYGQNYFKYDKSVPLELGRGFDITNPSETKLPLFVSTESKFEDDAAETTVYLEEIESFSEFIKKRSRTGSLNARNLYFKAGGQLGLNEKYFKTKKYRTIVFIAKTEFGNKGIINYELTSEPQKLLTEQKYTEFIEKYGSHFVQKTNAGLEILVFISIKNEYFENLKETNKGANGNVWIVKGNVDFNKAISKAKSVNDFEIQLYTLGPKDGLSEISEILKSSENPIEDIKEVLSNYLKTFTRENSKTLGYFYTPMTLFGVPKELINWNDTREKNLNEIKDNYLNTTEIIEELNSLKESCLYNKAELTTKGKLEDFIKKFNTYRDSLHNSFNKCLDLSDKYYSTAFFEFDYSNAKDQIDLIKNSFNKVIDKKLGTEKNLENNHSYSWTFPNTCINKYTIVKIDFNSVLAKNYNSKYTFTAKFDFYINDDIIHSEYINFSPNSPLKFSELFEYNKDTDEIDLKISISNVKIIDKEGVTSYSLEIPLSDASLEITIQ